MLADSWQPSNMNIANDKLLEVDSDESSDSGDPPGFDSGDDGGSGPKLKANKGSASNTDHSSSRSSAKNDLEKDEIEFQDLCDDVGDCQLPGVLDCSLCRNPFKNPRVLYCLHVFCEDCCAALLEGTAPEMAIKTDFDDDTDSELKDSSAGLDEALEPTGPTERKPPVPPGVIRCPVCQQDTSVGAKANIPSFLLPDFITVAQQEAQAAEEKKIECTSCKANEKAVARCTDCANFLCPNCVQAHQYMRMFEHHTVMNFDEMKAKGGLAKIHKPVFCPNHDELMKYYCATCEFPVCNECMVMNHKPPDHQHEKIGPDIEAKIKQQLQMVTDEANKRIANCQSSGSILQEQHAELSSNLASTREMIEDAFSEYQRILNESKDAMLKQADQICDDKEARLNTLQDSMFKVSERIQDSSNFAERLLTHGNVMEMLCFKRLILRQMTMLIQSIPDTIVSTQVKFVNDVPQFRDAARKICGYFKATADGNGHQFEQLIAQISSGDGTLNSMMMGERNVGGGGPYYSSGGMHHQQQQVNRTPSGDSGRETLTTPSGPGPAGGGMNNNLLNLAQNIARMNLGGGGAAPQDFGGPGFNQSGQSFIPPQSPSGSGSFHQATSPTSRFNMGGAAQQMGGGYQQQQFKPTNQADAYVATANSLASLFNTGGDTSRNSPSNFNAFHQGATTGGGGVKKDSLESGSGFKFQAGSDGGDSDHQQMSKKTGGSSDLGGSNPSSMRATPSLEDKLNPMMRPPGELDGTAFSSYANAPFTSAANNPYFSQAGGNQSTMANENQSMSFLGLQGGPTGNSAYLAGPPMLHQDTTLAQAHHHQQQQTNDSTYPGGALPSYRMPSNNYNSNHLNHLQGGPQQVQGGMMHGPPPPRPPPPMHHPYHHHGSMPMPPFPPNMVGHHHHHHQGPMPPPPPLPGMGGPPILPPGPATIMGGMQTPTQTIGVNLNPPIRTSKANPMQIRFKLGSLGPGKSQFNSPHGFCLGNDESIVVADTNNHRIQIFDKTGEFFYQFGIPGKDEGQMWYPRKVAVMRQTGKFVVCDRGNERSRMQIFTKNGIFIQKIAIRYVDIVAGLVVTPKNLIVAVDSVSPTVFVIDEVGTLKHWFDCSEYMREPSDIAVFGTEYFICDFKGHCVVVFGEQGQYLRRIGCENVTNFPNGIDISDAGDVLIGDSHGNRFHVAVFQREGELVSEFECPYVKVSRCCGLKITSEGFVITLAKNNHHLLVLNTLYVNPGGFDSSDCDLGGSSIGQPALLGNASDEPPIEEEQESPLVEELNMLNS